MYTFVLWSGLRNSRRIVAEENVKCQIHKLYSSSIQNETSEIDVSIPLTDRQYEVAQIATEMGYFDQEGTTTKEIAEELDITPSHSIYTSQNSPSKDPCRPTR